MDLSEVAAAEVVTSKWVATPGIHRGVPNALYHADTAAVSSSRLKAMLRSPAHFLTDINKDSRAKDFGSALHCLLLEPERYHDEFLVVRPFERRSKSGQELARLIEQAAGHRAIVSDDDYLAMLAMVEVAKRHKAVRDMLAWGEPEVTYVWRDEETGILLKARPDWLQLGECIWDVKTAADGSVEGFSKAAASYAYHLSGAMYRAGVQACSGGSLLPFRFVVCEKGAPFAVSVYEADRDFLRRGEQIFRKAVTRLAECQRTGLWPAYQQDEVEMIGLPAWA